MMCEYLGVLATVRARVLTVLKSVYLSLREVKVQRVTVVKFGMYNRSGDGVCCVEVKVGTNAAYS